MQRQVNHRRLGGYLGGRGRRGKPDSTLWVIEIENLPLQRPKQFKFKQLKVKRNQFKQQESIKMSDAVYIDYSNRV